MKSTPNAEYGFQYQDGVYTQLSVPGSRATYAEGVNNVGEIVGGYHDHSDVEYGFLFDGSTYQTLDVPGAANCAALGINNNGEITFQCSSYGLNGSVLYSGFSYIVLQYPRAVVTYAYGHNDAGDVALSWQDAAQNIHGGCSVTAITWKSMSLDAASASRMFSISTMRVISLERLTYQAQGWGLRLWHHPRCLEGVVRPGCRRTNPVVGNSTAT